jgi:hypothetical protein
MRLGGPQNRSVRGGEEKNSHFLQGFEPSIIQSVAQRYTTELSKIYEVGNVKFENEMNNFLEINRMTENIMTKDLQKNFQLRFHRM